MKTKKLFSIVLLTASFWSSMQAQQYPGGVSTPSAGISITTPSGTTTGNVNGLAYKLYSTTGGTGGSLAGGFGPYSPTLKASGYYHNANNFDDFVLDKISDGFGIELTGKLYVASGSTSYQFRGTADDQLALIIDGATILDINNTTTTSASINLTTGYHDIIIRGREVSGSETFNLTWNGGSGSTFVAIPDANFFTSLTGPSAWYKTNDTNFNALADGTALTSSTWMDQSGNGNNVPYSAGSPTYYNTNSTNITNYNPSIRVGGSGWFGRAAYLNGFAYGRQAKTVAGVGSATNDATTRLLSGYGSDVTNDMLGVGKAGGSLLLFGINNSVTGSPAAFGAIASTQLMGGVYKNNNITATNNATLYLNNASNGTATKAWSTTLNGTQGELFLGTAPNFGSNGWVGNINEVVYYPWDLSAAELQKVNSYLAVKYGITLTTDYVNTSGATIFSLTTNAGYTNRIFGIGQELAAEALSQRQSQSQMVSTTGYDFLKVSKGALATNNALNTGTLADGDYLLLGDNNGALASQTIGIPTTFAAGFTTNRLTRQWKAQVTGAPGAITLVAGSDASFTFPTSNPAGISALVDTDGDGDFTTGTVTAFPATSVVNGVATFNNITIPDGAEVTFAWIVPTPGGVSSGLTHWYNNTVGTYSDAAATTSATDGDTFGSWTNTVAPTTWKMIFGSMASGGSSQYYANGINFNPAWGFNNYIIHNSGTADAVINTGTVSTFLAVAPKQGSDNYQRRWVIRNPAANDWDNTGSAILNGENLVTNPTRAQFARNNTQCGYISPLASVVYGVPTVFSTVHSNTATSMYMNGGLGTSNTYNFGANNLNFKEMFLNGTYTTSDGGWTHSSGSEQLYTEAIFYNRNLTATERQQVETYLSIKNGTTMAIASGANYLASDGTTNIYNKTTYPNNIFGIGRDDASGLSQKQSTSTATSTTDIVTIGLTAIATTNALNTGSFTADKQFLVIGNNGGTATFATGGAPSNGDILNRQWIAQVTGAVPAIAMQFSVDKTGFNVPALTKGTSYYLVIDTNNDGLYTDETPIKLTLASAGVWATSSPVTFTTGQTFTLAQIAETDLEVTKSPVTNISSAVAPGSTVDYTIVVKNNGVDAASNVVVNDTPTNLTISSVSGGGCTSLPCTIPTLANGASVTINVSTTAGASGTFDNSATVSTVNSLDLVATNDTDNTANGGTISTTLATDTNTKVAFNVYPNPVKVGGNINFRVPNSVKKLDISIFNMDGRKITELKGLQVTSGDNSIKNPVTLKGVYLIKVTIDGKESIIKKLIVE